MKLLVVDDEPLELEQLTHMIKQKWPIWEIHCAEETSQALKLSREQKFVLAFIDIHLPGISGLELIETLKRENPNLSFVITTAYQNFAYAQKSIKLGVVDYIVKPIIASELDEAIKKFIERSGYSLSKTIVIEQVLEVIGRDFSQKISLESLAETVHVSPTYLSKKFSEEMELSIPSYIMKYRIEKAKSLLLKHPDYSMALIADVVGFHSQNYFNSIFKKYEGLTPSKYKELKSGRYD
ncbi:MAG TPA: response regulator [Desulfosporosinus sp.]|nr:response regulator [Desulfosporosinus sp.]